MIQLDVFFVWIAINIPGTVSIKAIIHGQIRLIFVSRK